MTVTLFAKTVTVFMSKMSAFIEQACPAAIISTFVSLLETDTRTFCTRFKNLVAKSIKSYIYWWSQLFGLTLSYHVSFVHNVAFQKRGKFNMGRFLAGWSKRPIELQGNKETYELLSLILI